ncbi:hypothetical protein BO71DRAFT_432901 [Aspergillus ellipticus CBS 707.79]|uniref:F-box domain-containing protein n=1 Tax=Aspergillus ellipticus CBS 707.79 TaxID=1448320 RepID=A0A319D2D0_9EURO|nr:hypothetical protein BO71DRAFT_432901 [Aspergillus ellipticus CBS 707.79]
MDRLPLEITDMIAVWTSNSRESLRSLSQLSRQWNEITRPYLFRHLAIRLAIDDDTIPQKIVQRLECKALLAHIKPCVPKVFHYTGHWPSIVALIREIPCLQDFNSVVLPNVPRELRQAFHGYHPTCQLSVLSVLGAFLES